MSKSVTSKWSTVGLLSAFLLGGSVTACISPQPNAQADGKKAAADGKADGKKADAKEDDGADADEEEPKRRKKRKKKKKGKKKRGKGVTYDGKEWERVRETDSFGDIDRMMLKLRQKQPIHYLGVPMRQIPTDNWLMTELIFQIKPDFIIEAE